MPADHLIFVGFEVTPALSAAMAECKGSARVFVDDPTYLEFVEIGSDRYVGKRVAAGASFDTLEDTARSVVSLLSRACPAVSLKPADSVILAGEVLPPDAVQDS